MMLRIAWAAVVGIPALVAFGAWAIGGAGAMLTAVAAIAVAGAFVAFAWGVATVIWHWLNN